NTTISIRVNLAPPSALSYAGTPFTFTQGATITTATPSVTGTVTSCNSDIPLPAGLGINGTTCAISGTPTTTQSATNYTITASNAYGSTNTTISI
ncbi:Ig domain-containing protein, partial [Leptospira interrogans]